MAESDGDRKERQRNKTERDGRRAGATHGILMDYNSLFIGDVTGGGWFEERGVTKGERTHGGVAMSCIKPVRWNTGKGLKGL